MTRRRYVYREVAPGEVKAFEVGADYTDAPRSTGDLGKFQYDNCQAPDGADISSRSKLNRYLKETGQCLAGDFKGEWDKAAKQREAVRNGEARPSRERLEKFGREAYRRGLLK